MKTTSTTHVIARRPSRADSGRERRHRNCQRDAVRAATVVATEQRAREDLATAIRWLEQACALDAPPGYVPSSRVVRAHVTAAVVAANRARAARRKADRRPSGQENVR